MAGLARLPLRRILVPAALGVLLVIDLVLLFRLRTLVRDVPFPAYFDQPAAADVVVVLAVCGVAAAVCWTIGCSLRLDGSTTRARRSRWRPSARSGSTRDPGWHHAVMRIEATTRSAVATSGPRVSQLPTTT